MSAPLTVHKLTVLGMLAEAVQAGRKIARLHSDGSSLEENLEWGIARAFTREGGGFLTRDEDVRDGFVWVSGGNRYTERWWPVAELIEAFDRGEASFDYAP